MIDPSAVAILRTIDAALVDKVAPSLGDVAGRSALATIRHLLRLVRLRIELEGQILTDDIAALRPLLGSLPNELRRLDGRHGMQAERIEAALADDQPDPDRYPDLVTLGQSAGSLREALHHALAYLVDIRADHASDPGYLDMRASIRTYMTWQIAQEARLIAPAFHGHGPRR